MVTQLIITVRRSNKYDENTRQRCKQNNFEKRSICFRFESNLISVSKVTQNGYKLFFEKEKCMLSCNQKTYLEVKVKNILYEVELLEKITPT